MVSRRTGRFAALVVALALGLSMTVSAAPAGAQGPPVTVGGTVGYNANTTSDGTCFHTTSSSGVDARLRVGPYSVPLRGVLFVDRLDTGYGLCGPSSFRFASFYGALTGPVSSDTVDCHGTDPNPVTACTLDLGLDVTDGTGLFRFLRLTQGRLHVQLDFTVVGGQFPASFRTSGGGTIDGSLHA